MEFPFTVPCESPCAEEFWKEDTEMEEITVFFFCSEKYILVRNSEKDSVPFNIFSRALTCLFFSLNITFFFFHAINLNNMVHHYYCNFHLFFVVVLTVFFLCIFNLLSIILTINTNTIGYWSLCKKLKENIMI